MSAYRWRNRPGWMPEAVVVYGSEEQHQREERAMARESNVTLPATQAQVITAVQAAIQAAETSYPMLVFVAILE